jgi:hypothetical protein
MKRAGHLLEPIAELANLQRAFCQAARGKRGQAEVVAFSRDLERHLEEMAEGLRRGDVPLGGYHYFRIHDPKERLICAASFRERVLHHAIMGPCEPVFERGLIHHSYACRKGRGQTAALAAAQQNCRWHRYFLKLDIRKYFDSVDHAILFRLLARRFKDVGLLLLFRRLLDTYQTQPGKGLPIGNLTSQHFANFYLNPLDRLVTETRRCGAYVRYMDDFVLWDADRDRLLALRKELETFLQDQLALRLKERAPVHRVETGLSFLGFRVCPGGLRLDAHSKKRLVRKYRCYQDEFRRGQWTELEMQQRLGALFAFAQQADSRDLRGKLIQAETAA